MDKRAILGIALSILVLIIYQELVSRFYPAPPAVPAPAVESRDESKKAAPNERASEVAPPPVASPSAAAASAPQAARDVTVDTENYTAVFTTRGARLRSFTFKKYRATAQENSPPFDILQTSPEQALPLGVRWQNPEPFDDGNLVYAVDGGDLNLTGAGKGALVFRGRNDAGVLITKTFRFEASSYAIAFEVSAATNSTSPPVPELLITSKSDRAARNQDAPFEGVVALVDNKIKREGLGDAGASYEFSGAVSWAGFGYTYFFFGLLPENGAAHKVAVRENGPALVLALSGPAAQQQGQLFIGPKELDVLKAVGRGLERAIDFGYFGFVSIPFLYVLHFFHRFTASYGLDIILLTVLIKVLMAPLTHKSFVSMKQMQKLQPQMEKIKERYGNDKEKLNKEIMELYRRNGVNPLGGCLPMLLQFPVFIGLYNALSTPIELRHAPFLWIKDLSRPDWESLPLTIAGWHFGIPVLTILMGASMFVQQWMTPSAGDPNQRKIMMLMPLMFTFMFVSFPAGLTVYWLVNNILTIAQQYWINRHDS